MNAFWDDGWVLDDRADGSDHLTFMKSHQKAESIDDRARESSQDFYFTAPWLGRIRLVVTSPPKVTLVTPKNMVAGTLPQADPVDLHKDKQEQRILDLSKNGGDLSTDTLRVAVYHPLLRSPSGVKLAGWSSGPKAWTLVVGLVGLLTWIFKEDIFHPWAKNLLGIKDGTSTQKTGTPAGQG
jgi:hypothetical protein